MEGKRGCDVCANFNQERVLEKFFEERINIIKENKSPIVLSSLPLSRFVMHLIPENYQNIHLDIRPMEQPENYLAPLAENVESIVADFNFNGIFFFSSVHDKLAYTQLFRDARVETVVAMAQGYKGAPRGSISLMYLEQNILSSLSAHLQILKRFAVLGPFYLYCHLFGIENIRLSQQEIHNCGYDSKGRNKAVLIDQYTFPPYKIDNAEIDLNTCLLPLFDTLWNGFGFSGKPPCPKE